MKLIQAYVSLYVCKYVFFPPLAPADLIESGGYGNCKILTVDLMTVSKQGTEFLFAKFWVEIAESRKKKWKVMMRNQQRIAPLYLYLNTSLYMCLSLYLFLSLYLSLSLSLPHFISTSLSLSLSIYLFLSIYTS